MDLEFCFSVPASFTAFAMVIFYRRRLETLLKIRLVRILVNILTATWRKASICTLYYTYTKYKGIHTYRMYINTRTSDVNLLLLIATVSAASSGETRQHVRKILCDLLLTIYWVHLDNPYAM